MRRPQNSGNVVVFIGSGAWRLLVHHLTLLLLLGAGVIVLNGNTFLNGCSDCSRSGAAVIPIVVNAMTMTPKRANAKPMAEAGSSRRLPETVLMGYGSDCDKVRSAIHDGVNIVVWSFVDILPENENNSCSSSARQLQNDPATRIKATKISTSLDLKAIRNLILELRNNSSSNGVIHLIAFGGWNGPHIAPDLSALDWYAGFQNFNRDISSAGDTGDDHGGLLFDGIDWDFEGNDDLNSPYNTFTVECLEKIGEISQMAKNDGYIVSLAPPQSYLDILGSSRFSRSVNLTDPDPNHFRNRWHADFSYFGWNAYAYLLAKYGSSIDLISLQFYESYSRAATAVYHKGMAPSDYLVQFVDALVAHNETFYVDFSEDPSVHLEGQHVAVPLSKLVIGLANGWASADDGSPDGQKALFISPDQIEKAWGILRQRQRRQNSYDGGNSCTPASRERMPRGLMFWTINEEGRDGFYFSRSLSKILEINSNPEQSQEKSRKM